MIQKKSSYFGMFIGALSLFCSAFLALAQTAPLQLTVNGTGKITGAVNGQAIKLGSKVTLTAVPGTGQILSNWTDNAGNELSTKSPYSFTNQQGTSITATFVPNPWPALKGDYYGVYLDPANPVNLTNAGSIKISLTDKGAFTGQLQNRGAVVPISGAFNIRGDATVLVTRPGKPVLCVSLNIDPQDSVMRSVSGTVSEATWSAQVTAMPKLATLATGNAASVVGNYTFSISPNAAMGFGAGIITIKSPNTVQITGNLPDGSPLNISTLVASDGAALNIPVFAALAGGKGMYAGWINLANNAGSWDIQNLPAWFYADGSDSGATTQINRYQKQAAGPPVTGWTYGEVSLMAGGLPDTNSYLSYITVSNTAIKVWQTTVGLALTVDANSGAFSGSFKHPVTGKVTPVKGVFVPDEMNPGIMVGLGWFMGPSGTGDITIYQTDVQPPPQWAPKSLAGCTVLVDNEGGTCISFTTAGGGGYTELNNLNDIGGGTMTCTYQVTGLTTAKFKFSTSQASSGDFILTWTSETTLQMTGTTKDNGGTHNVTYTATVSSSSKNAPDTLVGTTWSVFHLTDRQTETAAFSANGQFTVDGEPGTYSYTKTGPNTATLRGSKNGSFSMTLIFTSPNSAYMYGASDKMVVYR